MKATPEMRALYAKLGIKPAGDAAAKAAANLALNIAAVNTDSAKILLETLKGRQQQRTVAGYLSGQYQKRAVQRLPIWMDRVDAELVLARRHVNRLYAWFRWLLALLLVLGLSALVLVWLLLGGAV